MFTKSKIIGITLIALAAIILIVFGAWIGSFLGGGGASGLSQYSIVSLSTGELYFGKLSWFPSPHMTSVWSLSSQKDQSGQTQLGLNQFQKAVFAPVDEIYFDSKQIIWWSRLRNDSQIAKAIENPSSVQQVQQQLPQATSTFRGPSGQPPR